jgi:hypothetical protein
MSSAKIKSLALWSIEEAEFMNRENNRGDNKAPWGTPEVGEKTVEDNP